MRSAYATDFAITNSGGLRADLTCPTADRPEPATSARPSLYPVAGRERQVPDHARPGARRAAVRERVRDADDQRSGAEGLPRDGRLVAADDGQRAASGRSRASASRSTSRARRPRSTRTGIVNPGHRAAGSSSAVRQAADGSCTGAAISFSSRRQLHADHERLHCRRRRRLPEQPEPDHDAGHPRPGSRGLPRGRCRAAWSARRSRTGSTAPTRTRAAATNCPVGLAVTTVS